MSIFHSLNNNKVRDMLLFLILAIVLSWLYFSLPPLCLYIDDQGAKYIQMKSFQLHHWQRLDIEYPGNSIGLDISYFNPVRSFIVNNNALYCTYPPLFPFISSLFLPFLGDRVIHFLPLLTFFFSSIILARTLKMVMQPGLFLDLLLLIFLIGSPVFLYSIIFWEHLPALFLVISSLYYLVCYFKKDQNNSILFISSLLLGLGIFFRTEMLFFCFGFAASLVWVLYRRGETIRILPFAAGLFVTLSLYIIFNLIAYGNLLGLHVTYNRPGAFSISHTVVGLICLFVGSIAIIILSRYQDKYNFSRLINLIVYFWLTIILVYFTRTPVSTLIFFFPLFFIIFIDIQKVVGGLFYTVPELGEVIWGTIIIYTSLIVIFLYKNSDVSERYVLQVVPLVIIFMGLWSQEIVKLRPLVIIIIVMIAISFFLNFYKFKNNILRYKFNTSKRIEFLEKKSQKGNIIIFNQNYLMESCGPLYFERIFIVRGQKHDAAEILKTIKQKGLRQCFYWTTNYESICKLLTQEGYRFENNIFISGEGQTQYLIKIDLAHATGGE